uniref:SREBP regulating gene protein n=1 Tax=Oxyrrhis marina TaxID=2969 RepID=A0A7S3URB6_OXYMA
MRVEIASFVGLVAVTMSGCSGSGSAGIPDWPKDALCKTEDLSKIGDGDCTTADSVVTCTQDCGVPASQSCIQECYTKQCPDVNADCLSCCRSCVPVRLPRAGRKLKNLKADGARQQKTLSNDS